MNEKYIIKLHRLIKERNNKIDLLKNCLNHILTWPAESITPSDWEDTRGYLEEQLGKELYNELDGADEQDQPLTCDRR